MNNSEETLVQNMVLIFDLQYAVNRLRGIIKSYKRFPNRTSKITKNYYLREMRRWHNVVNLHLGREIE